MNRILLVSLTALIVAVACKKIEATSAALSTKEVAANAALIDYDSPRGDFTCRAPRFWKAEEGASAADVISFIGPPTPRGMTFIHIFRHPSKTDRESNARKYAESFREIDPAGKRPQLETKRISNADVIFFHQERPQPQLHSKKTVRLERHDYALIPTKNGFFEIIHSAAADHFQETLPIFDAIVRSFKSKI